MKTPMTKLMLAAAAATLLCIGTRAGTTLDDGLVAYYKFDGDIADSSGNGYDWTGAAATWTTDRGGEDNRAASSYFRTIRLKFSPRFPLARCGALDAALR
ncbi:MAG: hypothetical protein IJG18_01630 [Kiritimatiellae bacterium]|nr:hypothetical protein [Kiritimatiellia bacterium]